MIPLKAVGLTLSALSVIGGISAAYHKQSEKRLSLRNTESVTTESGQSAVLPNFNLNQEDYGQFSVLSPSAGSLNSSSYAPIELAPAAEGETPTLIYGYALMGDYCPDGAPCMMSFQSDAGNGAFVAMLDENLFWIDSAVFADGKYYICQSVSGNWGYLFDTTTWKPVVTNTNLDANCISKSLAWDKKNNVVYGCFNSTTKNKYDLATFDLTTQKRVKTIASNTKLYGELVCDDEGNLYGFVKESVNKQNQFVMYKLDTESGVPTKVGNTGALAQTFTSAFYDSKNKKMYLVSGSTDCNVYTVDLLTGEATLVRKTPGSSAIRGCYAAEVTVADDAPNMVTDLETEFEGGALTGKVKFTLPVRTYNGNTSDAPLGYIVSVNGKEYANVAPTADLKWGQSVEAPVSVEELGKYTFSVAAQIPGSVGAPENITKWIGNDYPEAPRKVSLIYEQPNLYLTWDSVKNSQNGGFIDPEKITYRVFDSTGKVLTDFIKDTKWGTAVDKLEDGTKYDVVAYHEGLASNVSASNTLGILTPPYRDRFSSGTSHADWTVINANSDKFTWHFDDSREDGGAYIRSDKTAKDDYLVSPPLALEAGKSYNLFITADSYGPKPEEFEVVMGTAPTVAALATKVMDKVSFRSGATSKDYQCPVKVDKSGVYYIAIHAVTPESSWGNLYIYDFDLSEPLNEGAPGYGTLEITDDPDRKLLANLKIGGPSKTVGGEVLKSISRYEVYRDEKLVKTIENPGVGAVVNYTDQVPFCGNYKYAVVSFNENGKGRESREWVYVGVGKPDKITGITVKEQPGDGGVLDVSWSAPTMDINGRSIPADSVYYDVVMDGKWRITKGSNATSVTVKLNPEDYKPQQFKYFYVEPYSSAGSNRDGRIYSEMVPVGAPYTLPFIETTPKGAVQHNWALSGSHNKWQPYNSVGTPQCYPQDNDGGLWGWIPAVEGDQALLITGKILVSGENPTASFYYRAISDSKNEIHLVYREMGQKEWTTLHKLTLNETGKDDWVREFVSLSEIKGKKVQLGFGGVAEDTRYIICIDNMYIGDIVTYDAALVDSDAPTKVKPGETVNVRATIVNNGFKDIDDAVISLVRGGKPVAKIENYNLPVGARTEIELKDETVNLFSDKSLSYYMEVKSSKDQVASNNVTPTYTVDLILPKTPVINDLTATDKSAGVVLTWSRPDILGGNPDNIVTEDFEDYKVWEIDRAGDWTFYDIDKSNTVGISGVSIPNLHKPMAYMLFDNSQLNYTYKSHAYGHKYLASFCSSEDKTTKVINNDNWLVSPKLSGVAQKVSLWAKTYNDYYGEEEFEFLYSTTDNKVESFRKLGNASVPMNEALGENGQPWTEYSYDLPQGALYFAIRHISKDGFIFMLDDITYNAGGGDIKLLGYNVYRNGEKVNSSLVAEPSYVDAEAPKGTHKYHVTAVYDLGESDLSNMASVDASSVTELPYGVEIIALNKIITVNGADGSTVAVATVDGKIIVDTVANGSLSVAVPVAGVYVVVIDNKPYKVIVK